MGVYVEKIDLSVKKVKANRRLYVSIKKSNSTKGHKFF